MLRNFTKPLFLFFILTLLCLDACKKKSENPDPTDPDGTEQPGSPVDATPEKTSYGIFDMVTINLQEPNAAEQINISVGGKETVMIKTGDKQYQFLLPVLPAGTHQVKLTGVTLKNELKIAVDPYASISDPDAVISAFVAQADEMMDSLTQQSAQDTSAADLQLVQLASQLNAQLKASIAKASETEKLEMAYFMRSLSARQNNKVQFNGNRFASVRASISAEEVSTKFKNLSNAYLKDISSAVGSVPVTLASFTAAYLFPNPYTIGLFAGSALFTIVKTKKVRDTGGQIQGMEPIVNELTDFAAGTGRAQNARLSSLNTLLASADKSLSAVHFTASNPSWLQISGSYRNMVNTDTNVPIAKDVLSSEGNFISEYNKIPALWSKAGAVIKWALEKVISKFDPLSSQFGAVRRYKTADLDLNNLSINNISNTDITLTATNDAGKGLKIIATNPKNNIREVTNFTFQIAYTQRDINNTITATIPATFRSTADSIALLKSKTWKAYEVFQIDPDTRAQSCNLVNETCNVKDIYNVFKTSYNNVIVCESWSYVPITVGPLTYTFTTTFNYSGISATQILSPNEAVASCVAGTAYVQEVTPRQGSGSWGEYRVINGWLEYLSGSKWVQYAKIKTLNATDLELEFYGGYSQYTWPVVYNTNLGKYVTSTDFTTTTKTGYTNLLKKIQRFR